MNQIIEHTPNKSSGGNTPKTDKIVRVFFVFMIIFAICIIGVGAYSILKNKQKEEEIASNTPTKAKITAEKGDEGIVVSVEHDKVIKQVIYNWDTLRENIKNGNNESFMTFTIPTYAGEHELNIKVIDIDDQETTYSGVFSSESGEDKINPTIDLQIVTVEENGENVKKLKIIAKDETAMDYVIYRWNEDADVRVDVSEEDEKTIEFDIDILKGQNDLVIFAYDKNGNNANATKPFSAVTKPDVKIVVTEDKKSVDITCTHENGLKSIDVSVNDQQYIVEIEEGQKDATVPIPLEDGVNKVVVKAVSVDNTETTAEEEISNETVTEDEITIDVRKNEENEESAIAIITTSGSVREIRLNVNDLDYQVPISEDIPGGLNFDIPLSDGNNVITLTVITANGTEKTETKELSR